jgi:hypothetical protein
MTHYVNSVKCYILFDIAECFVFVFSMYTKPEEVFLLARILPLSWFLQCDAECETYKLQ